MATLTKGKTFTSGETVTPTKLHELVDLGTVTNIVDADISASAAIALSKLATGALPTAITTTTANIVDASVTPAKLSQPPTLATAQASTSGTAIDFTGIPSWAKRITVMLNGVSTNGTSIVQLQVGTSSGFVSTGYSGIAGGALTSQTPLVTNPTTGCHLCPDGGIAYSRHGQIVVANITGNTWSINYLGGDSASARFFISSCTIALSAALDRVRITTVNGTDAFDAGSINIAYE